MSLLEDEDDKSGKGGKGGKGGKQVVVADEAAAAAKCAEVCSAKGYCCNDYTEGSNQFISCSQACMIRVRGTSFADCTPNCATRKCSLRVNGHDYAFCSSCSDRTDSCPHGVQSSAECEAGCAVEITMQAKGGKGGKGGGGGDGNGLLED